MLLFWVVGKNCHTVWVSTDTGSSPSRNIEILRSMEPAVLRLCKREVNGNRKIPT